MSNILRSLAIAMVLAGPGLALAAIPSPVGRWRTFDDADGKESGSVTIFDKNGALFGAIASIADPAKANALCTLCTDDRKNVPILGMQILRGLKPDGSEWSGGEIVDPKNGKTYRCWVRLEEGGQKLLVHGYIGISIVGRSQTWVRE